VPPVESESQPTARRALRRAWLPLVWLLGTGAAVLVGWSAVQAVVGQVVRDHPEPLSAQAIHKLDASPASSPQPASATPSPPLTNPPASSQPASTQTPPPVGGGGGTPAPPAPTSSSRTFSLQGGTVDVTCKNNQISLYWAVPNSGFQVETEWHDSNTVLEVRFTSSTHESRIETWCSGGQVQSTIEEQSS
jgi:cytoskeletal protein RodZ